MKDRSSVVHSLSVLAVYSASKIYSLALHSDPSYPVIFSLIKSYMHVTAYSMILCSYEALFITYLALH